MQKKRGSTLWVGGQTATQATSVVFNQGFLLISVLSSFRYSIEERFAGHPDSVGWTVRSRETTTRKERGW